VHRSKIVDGEYLVGVLKQLLAPGGDLVGDARRGVRRARPALPSIDQSRACNLEITICDLKLGRTPNLSTAPYAFTEQGVAMLSSVLNSPRAIAVNIEIMRAFLRLRLILASNEELARRLDQLEGR
jgi:hypothetical protein